jgi:hypothetical protein
MGISICHCLTINITEVVKEVGRQWERMPKDKKEEIQTLTVDVMKFGTEMAVKYVDMKLFCNSQYASFLCIDLNPYILKWAQEYEDNINIVF